MTIKRAVLCAVAVALVLMSVPAIAGASIVNRVSGRDDVWSAAEGRNLTYCVSDRFGVAHGTVTAAVANASAEWEAATSGRLDYIHVVWEDHACNKHNDRVVFSVEPTNRKLFDKSFYPSTPEKFRRILLNLEFVRGSGFSLLGVMRHELGHTLGLRHEHTRPEAGTCFEDDSWRALTPYDSASVMHYPQCNGTNSGDLVLTTRDAAGAASLYP